MTLILFPQVYKSLITSPMYTATWWAFLQILNFKKFSQVKQIKSTIIDLELQWKNFLKMGDYQVFGLYEIPTTSNLDTLWRMPQFFSYQVLQPALLDPLWPSGEYNIFILFLGC